MAQTSSSQSSQVVKQPVLTTSISLQLLPTANGSKTGNSNKRQCLMDGNEKTANTVANSNTTKQTNSNQQRLCNLRNNTQLFSGNQQASQRTQRCNSNNNNKTSTRTRLANSQKKQISNNKQFLKHHYICSGCNKPIQKDKYLLKACDKYWHENCLKCDRCKCRLGEIGSTLYSKSNLILCRQDYIDMFGKTGICFRCEKIITATELVMKAKGNVYHLECFSCQLCNQRFCVGDRFYLCDNKIICQYDYDEHYAHLSNINLSEQPLSLMENNGSDSNINNINSSNLTYNVKIETNETNNQCNGTGVDTMMIQQVASTTTIDELMSTSPDVCQFNRENNGNDGVGKRQLTSTSSADEVPNGLMLADNNQQQQRDHHHHHQMMINDENIKSKSVLFDKTELFNEDIPSSSMVSLNTTCETTAINDELMTVDQNIDIFDDMLQIGDNNQTNGPGKLQQRREVQQQADHERVTINDDEI